jgi:hypothetical protein
MPSVFTLEAPTGFGEPTPNADYLELLGDPTLGYDTGVGHVDGITGAMMGDVTGFFADRGLILGSIMAFGSAVVIGTLVGNAAVHGLRKLGWRPPGER